MEEQFYLVWPFLLQRFYPKRTRIAVVGIVLAALIRPICYHITAIGYEWFPCIEDALAMGCFLAMVEGDLRQVRLWIDRLIPPIVAGVLILLNLRYPPGLQPLLIQSLVNLLIVCMIDNCVRKRYWILNCKPVVWLGTLSFSLYLWQMPFFPQIPVHRWYMHLPVAFPLAFGCALLSYYLVERPFLRLRKGREVASRSLRAQEVLLSQ